MPSKVFISCGQDAEKERLVASALFDLFKTLGFEPYAAIQAQSIQDVNSGIIENLKNADYYVFIDFRRDRLHRKHWFPPTAAEYRGSLFTNQELAIAYVQQFDRVLFLQQEGIRLEGMNRYILGNARKFSVPEEVVPFVKEELNQRGWKATYSRHLVLKGIIKPATALYYAYGTHVRLEYIWLAHIENRRTDKAAVSTTARVTSRTDPSGTIIDSPDRSDLKWAGQPGYQRLIRPGDTEMIDAFALDAANIRDVYLHSALDFSPKPFFIQNGNGSYVLHFEIYSEGFPKLEFDIGLDLTGNYATTSARVL